MVQERIEREPAAGGSGGGGCQRADFSHALSDAWGPASGSIKITSTQSTSIEITPEVFAKAFTGLDANNMAAKMPSNEEIIAMYKRRDFDLRTTDPGFYGGDKAIERQDRAQAILEKEMLNGTPYYEARRKAGMGPDIDPYMNGGPEGVKQQALYDQYLRDGLGYQAAREKSGMGRDIDPGMCGGEAAIEKRDRQTAWYKEYLRQGMSRQDAMDKAIT